MVKELKYGMVGGDLKALIGECTARRWAGSQGKACMRMLFCY